MTSNGNVRVIKFAEDDWRNLLITEMKRTGGDPSVLFEILEDVVTERAWEHLLDDTGNAIGSLGRLIEAPPPIGCGQKAEKVLQLLEVEHRYETTNRKWHARMMDLRGAVRQELGGTNTFYSFRLRRLREDKPAIAEQVTHGILTIDDGMKIFRKDQKKKPKLRRAVNMLNAKSAANTLTKFMEPDVIDELIDLLIDRREN